MGLAFIDLEISNYKLILYFSFHRFRKIKLQIDFVLCVINKKSTVKLALFVSMSNLNIAFFLTRFTIVPPKVILNCFNHWKDKVFVT